MSLVSQRQLKLSQSFSASSSSPDKRFGGTMGITRKGAMGGGELQKVTEVSPKMLEGEGVHTLNQTW